MVEASATQHHRQPGQGEWTYDDYLALPEDGRRYEIIEGVLYVVNAPSYDHQYVVIQLVKTLATFAEENNLGQVLVAPFEVHLSEKTRPVQPDLLFIRAENVSRIGPQFFTGPPDLIVEVISPSSVRTDQHIKFSIYEQAGVPEYWIANPITRAVEVFTLSGGAYALHGLFIEEQFIESVVLAGLQIMTSSLFSPRS